MRTAPDACVFLSRLVIPAEQYVETRLIVPDSRGASQHFCNTANEAIAIATRDGGTANVYVGACPRARRSGNREAITTVTAAWADLDFHMMATRDRVEAEQIALYRLERIRQRPTVLVHTGNGLQCWWLYDTPLELSDARPATYFESINRGLARIMQGDTVHDIARVLRVPGTMNLPDAKKRARGCVPVMARLLNADGPTYTPSDFQHLATVQATAPSASHPRPVPLVPADQDDAEIVGAFLELLKQLGSGHALVRTWRGDRFLNDASRSGWDMALVNQLVRAGIKDEFVPPIVRAYRSGRGALATDRYISRTLAKAKISIGERHGAA